MTRAARRGAVIAWSGALALLLRPAAALACPACYGGDEGPLATYLLTGALMSALPLGLIVGIGVWYVRSIRPARAARPSDRPDQDLRDVCEKKVLTSG